MDSLIVRNEKEFQKFINGFSLSQTFNLAEFNEILNGILQSYFGINASLKMCDTKDLNDNENNILSEKLNKINEKDNRILFLLSLYVLRGNIDNIKKDRKD